MERTVVDSPSFLPVPTPGQQLRSRHQLPTPTYDAQAGRQHAARWATTSVERTPQAGQPGVRPRCQLDLHQPRRPPDRRQRSAVTKRLSDAAVGGDKLHPCPLSLATVRGRGVQPPKRAISLRAASSLRPRAVAACSRGILSGFVGGPIRGPYGGHFELACCPQRCQR
ncbi:DUF6207 family protein [Streptomyces sp. ZSW22]|nr:MULTISPECIES: DUF6207 family protein [unclassified Streptomyces]MDN3250569.1 DUF6207 family protein [Streptomyces sp. ZSW22]MDN3257778.1 DUF6207 family protein [Streptomyces sp. MA25(2023)]